MTDRLNKALSTKAPADSSTRVGGTFDPRSLKAELPFSPDYTANRSDILASKQGSPIGGERDGLSDDNLKVVDRDKLNPWNSDRGSRSTAPTDARKKLNDFA